jgi:hypothetical protein
MKNNIIQTILNFEISNENNLFELEIQKYDCMFMFFGTAHNFSNY